MDQQDKVDKMTLLRALEMIDTCHPSEFYVTQREQWDAPNSKWNLRYSFDGGNTDGRLLTDKQLRLVLLKALAYDDLIKTMELKDG